MRKFLAAALILCTLTPAAFAVEGSEVRLRASTVPGAKVEAIGFFDITNPDKLIFAAPGSSTMTIPYAGITEFVSESDLAHHLGVGGTIVVGILKKRQRLHFLTVTYRENDVTQVASFEVSKDSADTLHALLHAKAPAAKQHNSYEPLVR